MLLALNRRVLERFPGRQTYHPAGTTGLWRTFRRLPITGESATTVLGNPGLNGFTPGGRFKGGREPREWKTSSN